MKRLLLFLCLLLCPGSLFATTYYVSKSGDDANSCATAQSPDSDAKLTIAAGISCLSAGDTLTVQEGTYDEYIYNPGSGLPSGIDNDHHTTIQADTGDTVTLTGVYGASTFRFYDNSYITFDGINMSGSLIRFEVSNEGTTSYIVIKNSDITQSATVKAAGGYPSLFLNQNYANGTIDHISILDNNIHDCVQPGDPINGCHGFYNSNGTNFLIEGNSIYGNTGHGVHFYHDTGANYNVVRNNDIYNNDSWGVLISCGDYNEVYNNRIYSNGTVAKGGGLRLRYGDPDGNLIANNTLWDNTGPASTPSCIYNYDDTTAVLRNNLCYNNSTNTIGNDQGGATVDHNYLSSSSSDFVDIDNDDAHLVFGASLAREQGYDLSGTVDDDYDGNSRPGGDEYDIGAYEFTVVISNVDEGTPDQSSTTVTWDTDLAADSEVEYGLTDSYGLSEYNASAVTSHSVELTGLAAGTEYHYRVCSAGFCSSDDTFTTESGDVTPVLSAVYTSAKGFYTITIHWTTDLASDTGVSYGPTAAYGSSAYTSESVTQHSITLTGLDRNSTYHFQCNSTYSGNTGVTTDATFATSTSGRSMRAGR